MGNTTVYFVDEDPAQRDNTGWALQQILAGSGLEIRSIAPLPDFPSYGPLLNGPVAFLIDEKLSPRGDVLYSGHQLASYIRGVRPDIPIFIITAFTPESVPIIAQADIEAIVGKSETEPGTAEAQRFRARFLRTISNYESALADGARRLHELIVKSVNSNLTPEEEAELRKIDQTRQAPAHVYEKTQSPDLQHEIEELKRLLSEIDKPAQ